MTSKNPSGNHDRAEGGPPGGDSDWESIRRELSEFTTDSEELAAYRWVCERLREEERDFEPPRGWDRLRAKLDVPLASSGGALKRLGRNTILAAALVAVVTTASFWYGLSARLEMNATRHLSPSGFSVTASRASVIRADEAKYSRELLSQLGAFYERPTDWIVRSGPEIGFGLSEEPASTFPPSQPTIMIRIALVADDDGLCQVTDLAASPGSNAHFQSTLNGQYVSSYSVSLPEAESGAALIELRWESLTASEETGISHAEFSARVELQNEEPRVLGALNVGARLLRIEVSVQCDKWSSSSPRRA